MKKGHLIRGEKGWYDYMADGNVVWRLIDMGYTTGYASVMWRGHKRDEPPSQLRTEIWARTRKSLMHMIDLETAKEIEQEDSQ